MSVCRNLILSVCALVFGATIASAELVDNPSYTSWAKCKPGTAVTYTMDNTAKGMQMTLEQRQTLKEVTPDKVVVELTIAMDQGGKMTTVNTQTLEHKAKVEKSTVGMPQNMKGEAKETGNETIEAGGKSYACKIIEFTGESEKQQMKTTGKTWRSEEVPGTMVKLEMAGEGQVSFSTKMTLVSIEMK